MKCCDNCGERIFHDIPLCGECENAEKYWAKGHHEGRRDALTEAAEIVRRLKITRKLYRPEEIAQAIEALRDNESKP